MRPAGLARRAANTAWIAAIRRREHDLPYWPPERIEALRRRRVRAIVDHAYATVPFYRRAMDARGLTPGDIRDPDDLGRLPLLDGTAVRVDEESFLSSAYSRDELEVFRTSGSESGVRRNVYWDRAYLLRGMALAERDRSVLMGLSGETGIAATVREIAGEGRAGRFLARVAGDLRDHQKLSIFAGDSATRFMRDIWSEQTLLPARTPHHHHLWPELPFDVVAERMNEIKPRVAFSFGSYIDQFFRYIADRREPVAVPRVWMYTGDRLSEEGKNIAEEQFGCRIYSLYSAMEAHRLGFQCERGDGFHLNTDMFGVRIVDDDGADLPPGEPGHVVVSNLLNRGMVLLNYRLGDRAALDTAPCRCGRTLPLLSRLEGRRSEIVRLADGRELSSLMLEGMFRDQLSNTLKVQFVQNGDRALTWKIVPLPTADPDWIRESVTEKARQVLGGTVVKVELVPDIPQTPQGKFLRVRRAAITASG